MGNCKCLIYKKIGEKLSNKAQTDGDPGVAK
jgi:hypothetical protein